MPNPETLLDDQWLAENIAPTFGEDDGEYYDEDYCDCSICRSRREEDGW